MRDDTSPPLAKCRSCGALVLWARMPSGALNPIDPEPRADGNVRLYRQPDGGVRGEVLGKDDPPPEGVPLRVSHFVTCPAAAEHRQRRLKL